MIEPIPGGSFLIARKIFKSKIWLKPPFYLKTFLWILGNANYSDRQKHGYNYRRGELITTYDEIIKGVSYYHNRHHTLPTLKQIRRILEWLETEGMIIVQPLRNNELGLTRADPRAQTRAYVGIRIIVVNYGTYQDLENYKGRHKGRPSAQQGHNTNKEQERNNIYDQNFLSFWKAYPNKVAKKKAYEAWNKLEKAEDITTLLPILLDAIEKQQQAKEIKKAKGEFVPEWPHGATWLNGRRWEDEFEVKKRWDEI